MAMLVVGPLVLLGLYIVAHGHLTPGGGFQGGVILAGAALLTFLAGDFASLDQVTSQQLMEGGEMIGAGGYVAVGVAGTIFGTVFMDNWLPLGTSGNLNSGGFLPILNIAVGLAVSSGLLLVLFEFLEQTLVLRHRSLPSAQGR
jgi:multicomponent Na+:H+ antiporter subunit B